MDFESTSQAQSRESESLLLRTLDAAQMISFDVDPCSGEISRKGALCDRLDVGRTGAMESFLSRVHFADRESLESAREHCTPESPGYCAIYRFENRDRTYCWLREDGEAFFDESGQQCRIIGTCRDVTNEQTVRHELEKQRRQLKAITDATPAMIGYVDSDQCYQFVNAAYVTEFGKPSEAIVGRSVRDVVGQQSYRQLQPHLESALAGHKSICELVLSRDLDETNHDDATPGPEGIGQFNACRSATYKEVTYVPDFGDGGDVDGCYVLAVDITQQKQDANVAIERESHLQLVLQTARMGVLEWEVADDRMTWSDSLHDILGFPPGKIALDQSGFLSIVHPDDRCMLRDRIASARRSRCDAFNIEFRVICGESGNVVWTYGTGAAEYDRQGRLSRVTAVIKDVTDSKVSEQKLAQNEHRLQQVVDGSSVGIAFVKANGDVATANDAALRMLGISRTKLAREGFSWTSAIRPSDHATAESMINELNTSGRVMPREVLFMHAGGKEQSVQLSFISVSVDDDEHVVFLVDLTEQKRYQKSADEARRLAENANATKSEFLANMSHEIRTPMSAIIGYLEILSRNLIEPDDLKCVSIIRHNSRFLLEIINDILDISKIEAGKLAIQKKRFRPEKLVADVRSLMDVRAAEKDLKLNILFDGEIPKTIRSDDKRLKQILVNLVGNAIKFTETGAVDLNVRYLAADRLLSFDVIDTGIGIQPKLLTRLFQPFTQGDSSLNREFGGTGLGLTISQRLAHLLGGDIRAESETGKGSVFSLRVGVGSLKNVPMVSPKLPTLVAGEKEAVRKSQPNISGKILVVDDRKDIRHIAKHFLTEAGAMVVEAKDGKDAIHCVEQSAVSGQAFDLIVMDMQMPVMDGYKATRQLRDSGFDKPIIALTAHAMRGDRQRCIDAGCSDYLTKPLESNSFVDLIASSLAPAGASERGARRVLVVEDLVEAADALAILLESDQIVVEKAYDGASAVELAENFRPDVVLLDLGLPDMSGLDVLHAIKRSQPAKNPHFVALTGRESLDRAEQSVFAHHLVKPVDIQAIQDLVDSLS